MAAEDENDMWEMTQDTEHILKPNNHMLEKISSNINGNNTGTKQYWRDHNGFRKRYFEPNSLLVTDVMITQYIITKGVIKLRLPKMSL